MNRQPSRITALRLAGIGLILVSAALLFFSLKLPLWQMRMEGPQYRDEEALRVRVYPDSMRGDLQELAVLNQYIGVHVPETLPQFRWLPATIMSGAVLGVIAILLPAAARRYALIVVSCSVLTALVIAALQAKAQMHDIGHKRNNVAMIGVDDFTPPLLGTTKIAQFEVSSRLGAGAWLVGLGLALQAAAAFADCGTAGRSVRTPARPRGPVPVPSRNTSLGCEEGVIQGTAS
ncbi:MAG TPA: hypothetical protein GYA07_07620 [Verrucomicrobia bacterium]|nr:hypothetical protein [Verrucomicrobiota bacterium]HOB31513.1 hypothetical protein [Verrucomicrobiota bacterium]HOP98294.1 hypothetical protein [Verrucomicrobiota bacterium]